MAPDPRFAAQLIKRSTRTLATGVVERQVRRAPDVLETYGASGFHDLQGDTEIRLLYLAEAVAVERPELFLGQVAWLKVAMTARELPLETLAANLDCIGDELEASLPGAAAALAADYARRGIERLATAPSELPSGVESEGPLVDLARRYLLAVLEARSDDAVGLVLDAFADGVPAPELCRDVIGVAQAEIGRMWQMNELHVAEEHLATAIAGRALAALHERAPRAPAHGHRALCSSVGSDLHDLGIRAVAHHLEWSGWSAVLLGASTPTPDLLLAIDDFETDLVAVSANVALQVSAAADLVAAVRAHSRRIPVLVGGGPFAAVPDLWQVIGADGCAKDAASAVDVASRLIS